MLKRKKKRKIRVMENEAGLIGEGEEVVVYDNGYDVTLT